MGIKVFIWTLQKTNQGNSTRDNLDMVTQRKTKKRNRIFTYKKSVINKN